MLVGLAQSSSRHHAGAGRCVICMSKRAVLRMQDTLKVLQEAVQASQQWYFAMAAGATATRQGAEARTKENRPIQVMLSQIGSLLASVEGVAQWLRQSADRGERPTPQTLQSTTNEPSGSQRSTTRGTRDVVRLEVSFANGGNSALPMPPPRQTAASSSNVSMPQHAFGARSMIGALADLQNAMKTGVHDRSTTQSRSRQAQPSWVNSVLHGSNGGTGDRTPASRPGKNQRRWLKVQQRLDKEVSLSAPRALGPISRWLLPSDHLRRDLGNESEDGILPGNANFGLVL